MNPLKLDERARSRLVEKETPRSFIHKIRKPRYSRDNVAEDGDNVLSSVPFIRFFTRTTQGYYDINVFVRLPT